MNKTTKRKIKPFLQTIYKGNLPLLGAAGIRTLLLTASCLMISWLIQQIIDLLSGRPIRFTLPQLIALSAVCLLLSVLSDGLAALTRPRLTARAMEQYKNRIFEKLIAKNIAAFSNENSAVYISALSNDLKSIETNYVSNIFVIMEQSVLFCGTLLLMFYYNPLLTVLSLLIGLLPLLSAVLTGNLTANAEKQLSDTNESYMALLKDSLTGFSVIKSFRAERRLCRMFAEKAHETALAQKRRIRMEILVRTSSNFAGSFLQISILLIGSALLLSGHDLSAGSVLVFVQLLNFIINPVILIPQALGAQKSAKALMEKLADALTVHTETDGTVENLHLQSGISISDLSFGYEKDKPVLHDIRYHFEAGKSYCLVGASGCGKSTFLNLLTAAYPAYEGSIRFDETELRNIRKEALYDCISVIQQTVFVFNASIRDNITMFASFPPEEIERAIRLSGLSSLLSEKGETYLCGENGCNLSGGEKQRIAIARSLLKHAQVLLVDEATASLDPQTAAQVTDAILHLSDLTRIVITHTLEAENLKKYDSILTLKNGTITETGSFEELMQKKGYFYSLYTVSQ